MVRIDAGLLIPGRGPPVPEACVIVDGEAISYAGPQVDAPDDRTDDDRVRVPVLMPGMWDCHGHFMGRSATDGGSMVTTSPAISAARAAVDVEAVLRAGFTSIREVGGLGCELAQVIREGILVGPTIYAAGAILSTTGGHGDAHDLPLSWVQDRCGQPGSFHHLCDGVPECLTPSASRRSAHSYGAALG